MLKVPDDVPIENKRVTGAIASAQGQVESQNFESRKNVLKYDDVMNRQREVIYGERRAVLEGADLHEQIRDMHRRRRRRATSPARPRASPRSGTSTRCGPRSSSSTRSSLDLDELEEEAGGRAGLTATTLDRGAQGRRPGGVRRAARPRSATEVMRELERRVLLSVLDRKWREHLYEMDYLREGIGLRAYSQRDPLVEYQREGFDMFAAMMDGIKEESVGFLFNLEVQVEDDEDEPRRSPSRGRRRAVRPAARGRRRRRRRARSGRPQIRAKGLDAPEAAAEPVLLRARPRTARPRSSGARASRRRTTRSPASAATPSAPAARARSTRVPRRPGRADRPDHARQRLTGPPGGFATPPSRATRLAVAA